MPKNNLAACKSKMVQNCERDWTACQSHSFSVVQSRMCSLSGFDQSNLHSTGVSGPRYKKSEICFNTLNQRGLGANNRSKCERGSVG